MASNSAAPYVPQDPAEVNSLVQALESNTTKKGKGKSFFSIRKATFKLPDGRTIDSWRMQDWDYKKPNLPTYARGLFTRRNDRSGNWEIVVRGYDKFFNHGEVSETEWPNVRKNTKGPYELSVKENGCIIFIAGLDDETIIVCSKHSTGKGAGNIEKSHSVAGEEWVERHLARVGKTKADLAKRLRSMNATAVAELCDDDFEEHVLAYSPDIAGLYLHGINLNLPDFATYPHEIVDAFADEWGFRKTMYITENDIDKVKSFLDEVAETGAYDGRDTEGFVIRCKAKPNGSGPSAPYHDWFFKYKFEEPYLMYRQWRECTRAIISGKKPRYKKHKKITEQYLLYARKRLIADPKLGKLFNQNHGIIALRDDFLKERGLTGAEVIRQEIDSGELTDVTTNVILVPIATIGCGKTTIGVALYKLFGWEQFQNDNVEGKANRPARFINEIAMRLGQSPVVFADRNNHQKRERAQFINDITQIIPSATFVALHWVHEKGNLDAIRTSLRQRVLARGDNHQTIHADTKSQSEILGIMDGFINRFQPLDKETSPDCDFDLVIDLDPLVSTRDNLEIVIGKLNEEYPKLFPAEMPTAGDLDKAIDWAMNTYKPETKHTLGGRDDKKKGKENKKGKNMLQDRSLLDEHQDNASAPQKSKNSKKSPKLEYFAVRVPTQQILSVLETLFADLPPARARVYRQLQQSRRLQSEFHVTLLHRAHASTEPATWSRYATMYDFAMVPMIAQAETRPEPDLGKCGILLERVVWDNRIMTFVVRLEPEQGDDKEQWASVNRVAHITVGTVSQDVKPKESNDLLAKWLDGQEVKGMDEEKVKGHVVLEGTVKGVLQKF
jgi:tRNA ligase